MANTETIARKNNVAKDYTDTLLQSDFLSGNLKELEKNTEEINKNLQVFKKDIEEGFFIRKTKKILQDFLVSENLFEGLGDDFKLDLLGKTFLSEEKIKKLKDAKKTINSAKTEQEAREELGLNKKNTNKNDKQTINNNLNNNLTDEELNAILAGSAEFEIKKFDKTIVRRIISDLKKQGITNGYMIKAILATIAKESKFNPKISEISYTNTSNGRIRRIFGDRVRGLSNKELNKLKSNDEAFWDRVYGPDDPTGMSQKYGNTEKGDGLKYRGRGFNGITFKSNYKKYGDIVGEDLVEDPSLLNNPKIASKVNAAYYATQLKRSYTKNKYNYSSINNIKDFDTALDIAININAGIGKDIHNQNLQENRYKAELYADNFILKNVA